MGKGDQRTKRGKIWRGSYGRLRPKERKREPQVQAPTAKKPRAGQDKEKQ